MKAFITTVLATLTLIAVWALAFTLATERDREPAEVRQEMLQLGHRR